MGPVHHSGSLDAAAAAARAEGLMRAGFVCSEAVFVAVGEQVRPDLDPSLVRLATGFGGGIGRCRDEVCGALSGGVMVLGLLYGRETPAEANARCIELAKVWREAFIERFGTSQCRPIYDRVRQPGGPGTCAGVAGETAALLVTFLSGGSA
ncbi:MAG: C-GCAxxG-C-C family protein [Anaerolineae bacterium]